MDKYKFKGHSFVQLKHIGKGYCKTCGLVRLNNEITRWCVKKGCYSSDFPGYKQVLKRLTK